MSKTCVCVCVADHLWFYFVEIALPNEQARMDILKIHSSKITKHGEIGQLGSLVSSECEKAKLEKRPFCITKLATIPPLSPLHPPIWPRSLNYSKKNTEMKTTQGKRC